MDILTPEQRRKSMQGNKSAGTKPELILAKAMYAAGLRYRKNSKSITGTPDFSFKKYKVAVFADGDFWHGRNWEEKRKKVGANAAFWFEKIERNIERDYKVNKKLCEDGWTVLRFWETDISKNLERCVAKVQQAIQESKNKIEQERALRKVYHKKIVIPSACDQDVVDDYLTAPTPQTKKALKKKAVQKTKDLLQYKYPEETITTKVAEDMLRYAVPKKK